MAAQQLREYQIAGVRSILDAYRAGSRSVLMTLPTGGGKTTAFTSVIAGLARNGKRSVILVHRRELATQAARRLEEFGIDYGFIMAGERSRPCAPVQIASVQTLVRRKAPPADFIVCDEAHLSTAATWQTILDQYPRARILGATATPWRLGGKPLVGAYDASVVVSTPAELRQQGFLCDYVGFSYLTPDLSEVKTTGGDYNEKQSAAAMRAPAIVANIVQQWLAHARHLSTVVFAVTVEHSQTLCAEFRAAGIQAEHLDGKTPADERKRIMARVESGKTRVLCNVGVCVEGLDIPRLKCCVLARPTKSLARAIQMMGRVRRPWAGQTARIHDHAFLIKQHGLPDADRDYTLSAKVQDPPSLTQCQTCLAYYDGAACPACGGMNDPRIVGERVLATVEDAEQFTFSSEESAPPKVEQHDKLIAVRWEVEGRCIEGTYREKREIETAWGKQNQYLIRGIWRTWCLPGTTQLDKAMAKVGIFDSLRITYLGLNGRRREFRVERDDGATP